MDPIKLEYPIDFEGRKLTELPIRRPKMGDVRRAREKHKDLLVQELSLVALLTGLPITAIEELDPVDYGTVSEIARGFFGPNEETL